MTTNIEFNQIESLLNTTGSQIDIAEMHGLQVGILCGDPNQTQDWQSLLLEALDCSTITQEFIDMLSTLKNNILSQCEEMSLRLLLADENDHLENQVTALGQWCHGFLSGLGLVGVTQDTLESEIIKEVIQDFTQIARVDIENILDTNDSDRDYMELVEYVRIATQNIYIELKLSSPQHVLH